MEEKLMFAVLGLFHDFRDFKKEEIQAWVSWKWLTKAPIEVEKLAALSTTYYKGGLMVFRKWIPNSSLMDYDFSWGAMWIKVEGLSVHINQVHVASNLLERFGFDIYFEGKTKTEGPQKFVRARTRMKLNGPLIPGCYLEIEQGRTKWIDFRYEGVFVFCLHCGRIGHKDSYCKKSPRKAKEDILKAMNKLCTEENNLGINENSIMPVYSRKIRGLQSTPELMEEEDMEDEEEEYYDGEDAPGLGQPDDDEEDPNGDTRPSRKRHHSFSGSNSSDSLDDFGRPSNKRRAIEEVEAHKGARKRRKTDEKEEEECEKSGNHCRNDCIMAMQRELGTKLGRKLMDFLLKDLSQRAWVGPQKPLGHGSYLGIRCSIY
ncbi:Protein piccolo [Bienertia sinuspersici]